MRILPVLVLSVVTLISCSINLKSPVVDNLSGEGVYEKDKTYSLTVLHTNDHHGRFWKNANGEYGMAARKTLIDQIRKEVEGKGGYVLVLDGGDVNMGVPESDLLDAEPDFDGMNAIGYDAMAIGNHEFDKPLSVLANQVKWADFPLLSANIYKEGQQLFSPYTLFNLGGLKVAVFGLTTTDTPRLVLPSHVEGLEFRDAAEEAKQLVPELRKKADLVFAVTHMGHYPNGKSGTLAPGDVELARKVAGIDLIIGGHSQDPVCMLSENVRNFAYQPTGACKPDKQNGAYIVQAHEWGKYVGRADFSFKNGMLTLNSYALLPVNLKKAKTLADGKKEKSTDCDSALIPLLCVHG